MLHQTQRLLRRSIDSTRRTVSSLPFDDGCGQWPVGVGKGRLSPGYGGVHGVGGIDALLLSKLDTKDVPYSYWERTTHALLLLLISKRVLNVDQLRRSVEALHPTHYASFSYYEKWAAAMAHLSIESGTLDESDIAAAMGFEDNLPSETPRFQIGDTVVVKEDALISRWRKPHLRVPGYLFGAAGTIERHCGAFGDPEFLAFTGNSTSKQHLYRVRFSHGALWPEAPADANVSDDTIDVEVYESWLQEADEAYSPDSERDPVFEAPTHSHYHSHSHDNSHDHSHNHDHLPRGTTETNAIISEGRETSGRRISDALVLALTQKGVITKSELHQTTEAVDGLGTKGEGPRLVARAWVDPEFRNLLLSDAGAAASEIGISASNSTASTVLTAVENTSSVHNLVVCTLCSCYPLSILGLSPPWYKSRVF